MPTRFALLCLAASLVFCPGAPAQSRGLVLTNDRTLDCSSPDSIVQGLIRPGMTEQQKAYTLWKYFVQRAVHKEDAPYEDNANTAELMNKYGYALCGTWGHNFANLATVAGLPASPLYIDGHVVAQVRYAGAWRVYDADMGNLYCDAAGRVLPLEQITGLTEGDHSGLPPIVSYPFYEASAPVTQLFKGQPPTQPISRLDGKWKYDLNLKPGAELVWSWYGDPDVGYAAPSHIITITDGGTRADERNIRQHKSIKEYLADNWDYFRGAVDGQLNASKEKWTWGYRRGGLNCNPKMYTWNGVSANGRLILDLGQDGFRYASALMDQPQNLQAKGGKLALVDPARSGSFILNFRLPYVYVDGWIDKPLPPSGLTVDLSTDGRTWNQVYPTGGTDDGKRIRLFEFVRTEPRFQLRATLAAGSAPLDAFKVVGVFHHAYNALPALLKGDNTLRVRLADPQDLAQDPLHLTYVYDQVGDDHAVWRHERSFTFTPEQLAHSFNPGDKHWPLMRQIRLRCGGPAPVAITPRVESEELDWGAYPYATAFWGVSHWNDFERGDRGQWMGKLTSARTAHGSDFALDNSLLAPDGTLQLKFIRFFGYLNRDTTFRCQVYVNNASQLSVRSHDARDDIYYETTLRGLKQGQWQMVEIPISTLCDPNNALAHPRKLDFMTNLYLQTFPDSGRAEQDVQFLIDDCVVYDGDLKHDPVADPDAAEHALADDPIWNAK